jgi:thymidylate kinase
MFAAFCKDGNDSSKIIALSSILRRALWTTAYKKDFMLTFYRKLTLHYQRLIRIMNPPGFTVAFLGTDGAGKSTIIHKVSYPLKTAMHGQIEFEHLRPNLLPSLASLFGQPEQKGPITDPQSLKPSGFAISLIRISYYAIDYVVGYWVKVFPAMVKRSCIWIFDRYFYDYLIDQRRSRISLPKCIVRLFLLFVPKPDIILCLGTDPGLIHARKPELSFQESQRQLTELQDFSKKTHRSVWIDTGCSIEESADNALKAITSRIARRYSGKV